MEGSLLIIPAPLYLVQHISQALSEQTFAKNTVSLGVFRAKMIAYIIKINAPDNICLQNLLFMEIIVK